MIAAGGTGGHVYPALAVAEALAKKHPQTALYFTGSAGLERDLVKESGVAFAAYHDISGGPIAGVEIGRKALSLVKLAVGTVQAFSLLARYRPCSLLLTGGWSGLPVALAAWLRRVPILIFLPDVEPGSTIRLLQRFARRVALATEASSVYFPPGKTVVTGYPLRSEILAARRDAALAHFGLEGGRRTLLIFGGSRGARSINQALLRIVPDLLSDDLQILHVSGTLDWPQVEALRATLPDARGYHAFPYLHHDMGLAFAASDLAICRAGASTLAEFPIFGLPAILIPYPHAWRYQKVNADYLTQRGAAVCLEDERMEKELLPTIRALLAAPARLAQMRTAALALARPDGAERVASELIKLAGGPA